MRLLQSDRFLVVTINSDEEGTLATDQLQELRELTMSIMITPRRCESFCGNNRRCLKGRHTADVGGRSVSHGNNQRMAFLKWVSKLCLR